MEAFSNGSVRDGRYLSLGPAGPHSLAYREWGNPMARKTSICVHGLTRNSRDFDWVAAALIKVEDRRVICPDVIGRGDSDYLPPSSAHFYGYPQYTNDAMALLAHLNVKVVDWIGTSMGGLIGMFLAAHSSKPISSLVLNDVGPFIPKLAIEKLQSYVGKDLVFSTFTAVEEYLRRIYASFGKLTDEQWRHMALHTARKTSGGYTLAYDQNIGEVLRTIVAQDIDLWAIWDQIACPVLVIRGAESDLLLPDTVTEMQRRSPGRYGLVTAMEVTGAGHAPGLRAPEQVDAICSWLARQA